MNDLSCLKSWAKKIQLIVQEIKWREEMSWNNIVDLNNIENIYIQEKVDIVMAHNDAIWRCWQIY